MGTLVGSFSSYFFQRRTAQHAEVVATTERLRQERLTAYSEFAGAASEFRRGLVTLWFRRRDSPRDGAALRAAQVEGDRLGAVAETARFRIRMVDDDLDVRRLAEQVVEAAGGISGAVDREEVIRQERDFEAALGAFVTAAAGRIR
ncbi:hypothetical protein ACFW1A_31125 [Kitasatospora sp. NPDC058965]|uniref:hypothetical protein n=1 Tax=Kitasatospora sp. NPDC058965 TaxID=3346682 RepID=UPI00368C9070